MAELHMFDPDGDLMLVLSGSCKYTAPREVRSIGPDDTDEDEEEDTDYETDGNSDKKEGMVAVKDEETEIVEQPTRLLVSSKHMSLASPIFKAMLGLKFKESNALRTDCEAEILLDDDPIAFGLLVNIAHGQTWCLPPMVDLKVLFSVAILADKYQMVEAAGYFCQAWTKELKQGRGVAAHYSDLIAVMWLTIAFVFRKDKIFEKMSRVLMRNATEQFDGRVAGDIPIPGSVFEEIKSRRTKAIAKIYPVIEEVLKEYQRGKQLCRQSNPREREACNSMIFGSFTRSMSKAGICPDPGSPYVGASFKSILKSIQHTDILALCDVTRHRNNVTGFGSMHAHGFKDIIIEEKLKSVSEDMLGLDLEHFQKEPTRKRKLEE